MTQTRAVNGLVGEMIPCASSNRPLPVANGGESAPATTCGKRRGTSFAFAPGLPRRKTRGSSISFPIGVGAVIGGWDEGLVGQQVGSRVLLSIPSHLGYGDRGVPQAGIKGGDTLVFVVDIVGTSN